ncbi:uncharacterized protein [Amphiura filiformis]|uniref:uncharacterized protein n=1 Tax=Amphiura filiformis TaxID=82378 RepID=UPI003B22603A
MSTWKRNWRLIATMRNASEVRKPERQPSARGKVQGSKERVRRFRARDGQLMLVILVLLTAIAFFEALTHRINTRVISLASRVTEDDQAPLTGALAAAKWVTGEESVIVETHSHNKAAKMAAPISSGSVDSVGEAGVLDMDNKGNPKSSREGEQIASSSMSNASCSGQVEDRVSGLLCIQMQVAVGVALSVDCLDLAKHGIWLIQGSRI